MAFSEKLDFTLKTLEGFSCDFWLIKADWKNLAVNPSNQKQNDLLFNFQLMHCLNFFQGKNTDEKALNEKTKIASDLKSVYDKLRENDENCANALKTAQARFEAISVGKFSSDEG